MTAYQNFIRDTLGIALIVSTILAGLSIFLDVLGVLAYLNHESHIATIFFHESFYFLGFLIPPYFIAKYINRPDMLAAAQAYQRAKSQAEQY